MLQREGGGKRSGSRLLSIMEPDPPTILIVEDHAATRRFLADNLAADGYEPLEAGTAAEGAAPDRDGLAGARDHRSRPARPRRARAAAARSARRPAGAAASTPGCPCSSSRAAAASSTGSAASSAAPTTICVKPFSYRELRGRIDALLRRARARPASGTAAGRRRWSSTRCRARSGSTARRSTCPRRSSPCCCALATEPTRVFTREELLRRGVGLSVRRGDAHAGLARLPPAAQAQPRPPSGSSSTCGASATGSSTGESTW